MSLEVVINGVTYVPAAKVPPITDERLKTALEELTSIQRFPECSHKHRAWAWDALNALAPEIAALDPAEAFDYVRRLEVKKPDERRSLFVDFCRWVGI